MRRALIVAMDEERGIGRAGRLAWHDPLDLAHFKASTMGEAVAIGRTTWESIGRPLPGRTVIVITSDAAIRLPPGVVRAAGWHDAQRIAEEAGRETIWAAGGTRVYADAIASGLDKALVTRVPGTHSCDAFMPPLEGLRLLRVRMRGETDYETWVRHLPDAI